MADNFEDSLIISRQQPVGRVSLDEHLTSPQALVPHDRVFEDALQAQGKAAVTGPLKKICVYCGSSPGLNPVYMDAAKRLGSQLASQGIGLVYGGGAHGIMGGVAKSVLSGGGHVTGIIPEFLLLKEGDFKEISEHHVVPDMHKRKMMMFDKADAFVALPGGVGTLEELIEVMTWAQLGRHGKPVLIANINNFWAPLLTLLEHMRAQGFIRPDMNAPYLVANTIDEIIPMLKAHYNVRPVAAAQVPKKF